MLCDFATTALPNGHFRHVCRSSGCGRDVQTVAATCALPCRAGGPRGAPSQPTAHRRQICHDCNERPAGCWKTREYGCQRAYREAGQRAAETADCPIGKLK